MPSPYVEKSKSIAMLKNAATYFRRILFLFIYCQMMIIFFTSKIIIAADWITSCKILLYKCHHGFDVRNGNFVVVTIGT